MSVSIWTIVYTLFVLIIGGLIGAAIGAAATDAFRYTVEAIDKRIAYMFWREE